MSGGVITFGDMERCGLRMLEVVCRRCDRRRRPRIAEHGAGVLDLRGVIAADCPRMRNPPTSIHERCGVSFFELPRRF